MEVPGEVVRQILPRIAESLRLGKFGVETLLSHAQAAGPDAELVLSPLAQKVAARPRAAAGEVVTGKGPVPVETDPWVAFARERHLFPDHKLLADAVPRHLTPEDMKGVVVKARREAARWQQAGKDPSEGFAKGMIKASYDFRPELLPVPTPHVPGLELANAGKDHADVFRHIQKSWSTLHKRTPATTESSLIPLPEPFVVPGGRFTELYYWDSYFTMIGLNLSGQAKISQGMADNFLFMLEHYGIVPNGNRTYYLSRSQPPFLTSMIRDLVPFLERDNPGQAKAWLERAYGLLKKEYYGVWMNPETHYVKEIGLNRYYDPIRAPRPEAFGADNLKTPNTPEWFQHERAEAESGLDFTARFQERAADFIPADLNALLYKNEQDLAWIAARLGKGADHQQWEALALRRKTLLDRYLWDPQRGTYADYDFVNRRRSDFPSLATFFPLYTGMASREQAAAVAAHLPTFLGPGGAMTSPVSSGKQWDAPFGWAPMQWVVTNGLDRYGFRAQAVDLAGRWVDLNTAVFKRHGVMAEKYDVRARGLAHEGGDKYPTQVGFGWTNGVWLGLQDKFLGRQVRVRK